MKHIGIRWLLPTVQTTLAIGLFFFASFEYQGALRAHGEGSVEFFSQHWPSPAEQVARGINFPAIVLMTPLNFVSQFKTVHYAREIQTAIIWIDLWQVGFWVCAGALWYLIGLSIATSVSRHRSARDFKPISMARLCLMSCGLVFGILVGVLAVLYAKSPFLPERHIAPFGIIWSCLLVAYFVRRMLLEFKPSLIETK